MRPGTDRNQTESESFPVVLRNENKAPSDRGFLAARALFPAGLAVCECWATAPQEASVESEKLSSPRGA